MLIDTLVSYVNKNLSPSIPLHSLSIHSLYPDFDLFVMKIMREGKITNHILLHALVYIVRLGKSLPKDAVIKEGARHKIFLVAILLASKFYNEVAPLSTGKILYWFPGLFTLKELNDMERSFLNIISYNLTVHQKDIFELSSHEIGL